MAKASKHVYTDLDLTALSFLNRYSLEINGLRRADPLETTAKAEEDTRTVVVYLIPVIINKGELLFRLASDVDDFSR